MSLSIIERICTKSACYQTNVQQKALPSEKQNRNYRAFYAEKRPLLILHSLGCVRDSADVQAERWDNPNGQAIAHACVDARNGYTVQTLPWDFRGWHAGEAGNNVAIGVEMAESLSIRYIGSSDRFEVLDREKARRNCETAYNGAVELFPAWQANHQYAVGERVRWPGGLYRCLQGHLSQAGWTPDAASSLWARVLIPDPEQIPEWERPDSTNPYAKGDKVRHNGKTWVSDVDGNVWEPGVYGWNET